MNADRVFGLGFVCECACMFVFLSGWHHLPPVGINGEDFICSKGDRHWVM